MDIVGYLPAEGLVKKVIFRRGGKVLHAPHYVGYLHQVVVHHVCEVIGGHAVCLYEYVVIKVGVVYRDGAEHHVGKAGGAFCGHVLADDVGNPRVQLGLYLLLGKVQAVLVVLEGLAPLGSRSAPLLQLFFSAEAAVGVAALYELLRKGQIHAFSFALYIGAIFAANVGAFVPVHAHVPEGAVDKVGCALYKSFLIRILYAEQELAVVVAGKEISVKAAAKISYVHIPRRRWGKACAYFHKCFLSYALKLSLRPTILLNTGRSPV